MPGFLSYVAQEILPEGRKGAGSAADEEKGLSSRESVYNTLLFVPLQVERLLTFGNLMCLDAFLGIFTLLPLRLISSAAQFLLLGGVGNPAHCARDLCWALQLGATVAFLLHFVHISEIYHYIHGQVQEVIKLYGFMTMLDIFDKILLNLHSDCLEALSASCTGVVESVQARKGLQVRVRGSVRLGLDLLAGTAVLMAHTFILICEAIAFSVAVTSYSPAVCGGGSSATRYVPSPRSLTFESATGAAPPGGFSVASHTSPPAGRGSPQPSRASM